MGLVSATRMVIPWHKGLFQAATATPQSERDALCGVFYEIMIPMIEKRISDKNREGATVPCVVSVDGGLLVVRDDGSQETYPKGSTISLTVELVKEFFRENLILAEVHSKGMSIFLERR